MIKNELQFSEDVLKGKVFGFAQVNIEVPNKLYYKFHKMAALFVVQEIPDCDVPGEMKIYKENLPEKQ